MSPGNDLSGSPKIPVTQNNTIILEVDNLLIDWPTYVIKFTPDQPGPLVCALYLIYGNSTLTMHYRKLFFTLKMSLNTLCQLTAPKRCVKRQKHGSKGHQSPYITPLRNCYFCYQLVYKPFIQITVMRSLTTIRP
jgi:hypothetical protein